MTVGAEWQETTIGALASISRGASPRPIASTEWFDNGSDVRWVRIADVNRSDGRTLRTTTQALSPTGIARSRYLNPGTLIMSIAATVGIPVITGVRTCIHDGFVALENLKADQRFMLYLLKASEGRLRESGQSGSQMNVNTDIVKGLSVRIPVNRREQERIADALWHLDDLIATLERLIAKKQAIKQGMMQQLLTGRTRLPGFVEEWTRVRLRDAGSTYGGLVGKGKGDFGTGSATFVTFMEVMAGARLRGRRLESVSVRPSERQNRVLRGDVLFNGSSETPEEVALAAVVDYDPTPTTYLNSFCFGYRLRAHDQIDPTFWAHFFRSGQGREIVSVLAQGATRYNIAKTKLMDVSPMLPPIDEQRAIVTVLSDAEAEFDALNVRLTKARAIKTGMMQQLLTGRTRFPVEEVAA